MRDENTNKRFIISFCLSLLIHCIAIFGFVFLYHYLKDKTPKLHKIDAENLLVLKRGRSLDKTANTPGAKKPSLAQENKAKTPPIPPSMPPVAKATPKPQPQNSQKTPLPNKDSAPNSQLSESIDPKNLKLFSPLQEYAQNTPNNRTSTQSDKGLDKETIRDIDELYGDEWGDLGSAEKDFVTSNLREIARITQSYLEYPQTAAYLRQDGENAVEFYLLPNGDIEGLKLIGSSSFVLLDKNSLKTIEIAFKDYPRPTQRTLIRFHITYRIFYR